MSEDKDKPYQEPPIHIDTIIVNLVAHHARLSDRIDRCWDDPAQLVRLLPLYGQNATRLGHLLRARFALYGDVYEFMQAQAQEIAQKYPEYDTRPQESTEPTSSPVPLPNDDTLAGDSTLTSEHPPTDEAHSDPDHDSHSLPIQIDDLIADMAAKQTRLSQHLDCCWQDPDAAHLDRLLAIYSQNATRLNRLLHDHYAIYGPPPDPFQVVFYQALDRLNEEWGTDL